MNFRKIFYAVAYLVGIAGCDYSPDTPLVVGKVEPEYDVSPKTLSSVDLDTKSVMFVIDTSGSMDDAIKGTRKIDSAKQSLLAILETYKKYNDEHYTVEAGLRDLVSEDPLAPFGKFDYNLLTSKVQSLGIHGGTPLGLALAGAERDLDAHAHGSKYIVLLTDGENNYGRDPAQIFRLIQDTNQASGDSSTELYVVPFNVSKDRFSRLENLGAHVKEARDGSELLEVLKYDTNMILEALPASQPKSAKTESEEKK